MTLALWIELITAALKFPQELLAIGKALSKTPEEKRQEIVAHAEKVASDFAQTGRPTWEG